jgi:hypothetical protein
LEAITQRVAESALTDESTAVSKDNVPLDGEVGIGDQSNMVFSGTAVAAGRGRLIVTTIGATTELGKIAGSLQQTKDEHTPLQKELARVGKLLGIEERPCTVDTDPQRTDEGTPRTYCELSDREGKPQLPQPGDYKGGRLDKAITTQHQLTDVVADQPILGYNRQEPGAREENQLPTIASTASRDKRCGRCETTG